MATPTIPPEYARGPIIVQHTDDGRYLTVHWSAICDRDDECETCRDRFTDRGHPVRTYRDAGDAIDLCDECIRDTAAAAELTTDEHGDPIPAPDYMEWADFDTVEQAGYDGTGRNLY